MELHDQAALHGGAVHRPNRLNRSVRDRPGSLLDGEASQLSARNLEHSVQHTYRTFLLCYACICITIYVHISQHVHIVTPLQSAGA